MTTEDYVAFAANVLGALSGLFSALGALQAQFTENEIAELDRRQTAAIEAAGLTEETTQERLDRQLEEAISEGDAETIAAARDAAARNVIIEEFERKKAQVEYKGALASWKLQLAGAIASGAQATLNGLNSKPFIPVGLTMGILAGATAGVQIGAVSAAKPVPAFAEGGQFTTNGAQTIQVGDNIGGREEVTVRPLSSKGANVESGGMPKQMILNIDGKQFLGWVQNALDNGNLRVPRRIFV